MQQTDNLKLNLIEGTDPVDWQPLNENFTALEAALSSANQKVGMIQQYLNGSENCKIAAGSYTGNGSCGSDNPNTLTLPFAPKLLIIFPSAEIYNVNYNYYGQFAVGMVQAGRIFPAYSYDQPTVLSVSGTTVSWYSMGSLGAQFNFSVPYYYVAIG